MQRECVTLQRKEVAIRSGKWLRLALLAGGLLPAQDDAILAALRARRFDEALTLSRAARGKSPNDPRLAVLEGMALNGLQRESEALATFQKAISLAPDYVPALAAAAEIEYRRDLPEAAPHLRRLLALHAQETTAHAMLGALAWKQGNCPGAVEHFGQAKPAIASQPDALREYGGCLLRLRKPDEAIVVLRDLAALRPEDAHARYLLALALMDATRFRDAIEALAPLAAGARPDAVALELTANAHEALGETPRAVELLREAMLLEPHRLDLYLDFASLAFAHQSFQVGIDVIDAGLTQLPDSAQLYLARGVLHVQLGEYPEADSDFDKAERLDPARAMGSVARSLAQVQQNNLDDALATVRAQLKMNSKDPVAHYVLADLLSRQGAAPGSPEFAQAVAAAQEAVRLRPDFFLARDILSRLYLEAGEKDKAIEQCRLALRDNPSDEIALYRLIRALQASGRADVKAEVPELLKRFNAAREETQKRQARESQYRLIEAK